MYLVIVGRFLKQKKNKKKLADTAAVVAASQCGGAGSVKVGRTRNM
jgi:hypothetical protein